MASKVTSCKRLTTMLISMSHWAYPGWQLVATGHVDSECYYVLSSLHVHEIG